MSSTGTTISRSISLATPASTISHSRLGPTRKLAIRSSGRCVAERPMRCSGSLAALALVRLDRDVAFEPLQRQRHVGAALGRGDGVDLVDDQRLDVGEDLARPRGHHQVERLGRGDQDVGRLAQHRLAILLRGVAGAQPDRDVGPDPGQRRPQVALDVVGEGLERRDVDELDPVAEPLGLARQAVDPPEERGQGLAGAGRRADQRVGAGRDRRPARRLGGSRPLEGALEPVAGPLAERRQRVGRFGSFQPWKPTGQR